MVENNWKNKYLIALRDLTDKEREWSKIEALLRKAIGRLSIAASGHNARLDILLGSVRASGRERGHETQFAADLEELSRELAESIEDGAANATTNKAPPIFCDVLENLLTRLALDESVSDDVKLLQKQLDAGIYKKEGKELIAQMADIINRNRSHLLQEKNELEAFLGQVAEILGEVSQSVDAGLQNHNLGHEGSINLQNAVNDEVKGIEADVKSSDEVNDLKKKVVKRISEIQTQVDYFRHEEEKRHAIAENHAKNLSFKLTEIETETADLKDKLHKNRKKLLIDSLTGVHSRLAYEERLEEEFKRWKRFSQPLTLVIWDVDYFKKVNDEFGHLAGDKALKIIATVLNSRMRETDFIGRLGGEEFISIFPGTNQDDAMRLADEIRQAVPDSGFNYNGKALEITISCGLSEFREGDNPQTVFKRADAALYTAKSNGRNRCCAGN